MSRGFVRRRKDANHSQLQRYLEELGAGVLDCSPYGTPFDLIVCWRGMVYLVEIKDGAKSPSRRELTGPEKALHALAKAHGCRVHEVHNETDAFALLGARRAV
jgi:hypothetical protein